MRFNHPARFGLLFLLGAGHVRPAAADGASDHTATDTAGAPAPGEESGRADQVDQPDSTARVIARGALWVPKVLAEVVLSPIKLGIWLNDRYDLEGRYYRLFYNDDRTIGIVPTGAYATGFGIAVGAHAFDHDVLGQDERIDLNAVYGGSYRAGVEASVDTGTRFDPVRIGVYGRYTRLPDEPFFGIGGGDETEGNPQMPLDPNTNTVSNAGHYRLQNRGGGITIDGRIIADLHVIGRGSYAELLTTPSQNGSTPINDVFNTAELQGFDSGVHRVYGELELRWDTRGRATIWEPPTRRATGSLVSVYGGRVHALEGGGDFFHYGADLQHIFRLGLGPRALLVRAYWEAVSGDLMDVPFVELPTLGGDFLRGYTYGQFHDRLSGFGTVQYQWDVSHFFDAYLFVDGGRVWNSYSDLTANSFRVGYGLGVDIYSVSDFLLSASVASSINGGVIGIAQFNLATNRRSVWR